MSTNQNTSAGTNGGDNVVTPTGNSVLDLFAQISNVGGSLLNNYNTFQESKLERKIRKVQALRPPMQETANSGLTTEDNAKLIKQMALYFGGASLLTIVLLRMRKK